jgi:hypothetical protein
MQYFLCPKCQFKVPANKHICQTCGYKIPSASEASGGADGADIKARTFSKLFGFNASKQKDSQQEKPALG